MKTKWGGCNPVSKNIRLNTELAQKPVEWKHRRQTLNDAPLAHVNWAY
jgi:hypothetical protein